MNIRRLLDKATSDWLVKAACFVIAVMVYFIHQFSVLESNTLIVPLEVRAEGAMTALSSSRPKFVKVSVRARRDQIASVTEGSVRAYVDISSCKTEGVVKRPVLVEMDDRVLLMDPLELVVRPSAIEFSVEERVSKAVPVKADVQGAPAYGYKCSTVKVVPAYVTIIGPKSDVRAVKELHSSAVSIEGESSNVDKVAEIMTTNSLIRISGNPSVAVSVSVVPEGMVKELKEIPVEFEGADESLEFAALPATVSVTLEGSLLEIEKFSESDMRVFADCSGITAEGEYELPIMIEVTGNLKVANQSADIVVVTVAKRPPEEASDSPRGRPGVAS